MGEKYSELEETQVASQQTSNWELEIKDLMEEMEEILSGKYFEIDSKTGDLIERRDVEIAMINDKGIRYLKSRMMLLANKWTALSVIERDDVKKFTLFFSDALRMELRAKKDDFDIKRHNFETLILAVSEFVFFALNKSIEQGERKYRRGIERRVSTFAEGGKRGIMGAVSGIFNRSQKEGQ